MYESAVELRADLQHVEVAISILILILILLFQLLAIYLHKYESIRQ